MNVKITFQAAGYLSDIDTHRHLWGHDSLDALENFLLIKSLITWFVKNYDNSETLVGKKEASIMFALSS